MKFLPTFITPAQNPIEKYFTHVTRFHIYLFTVFFTTKLPIFWHVLSLIFLSPPMTYTCKSTGTVGGCPCPDPEWNRSIFTQTVQTKYGILCETAWMTSFSQSMVYVGTLMGALSFGFMADKFGRLRMFVISCLTISIPGCLLVAMPNAASFIALRTIEGVGVGGSIVTSYVLLIEYCGIGYREAVTALYHIPINLGHMTLPGVSYFLRHCDQLQLALSIPVFFCTIVYLITYESPKWLIDSGNITKATTVMQKIAKFNKDSPETMKSEMDTYFGSYTATQKTEKLSFWHIFRHRKLTRNLMCMSVIYFVCGMGYYGVSQYIGKMSGDIHQNVAISGALLIPGTLASVPLLQNLGRRTFLMSTSFLSGIFMIIVILIPSTSILGRVVVACICNCFFFMSFIVVFLYGVELFPTTIRNSALGFLSLMSRVGQIIAPPINALPETYSGAVFGAMAIVGGLLCFPLPETKNRELPSSLEDTKSPTEQKG